MAFLSIFSHAVILTFDLLTSKHKRLIFVPKRTNDKFDENPSMHTGDIAETTPQNGIFNIFDPF